MGMRQPTTARQAYAWHNAAIAGESPPIHDGCPEAGWFKTCMTPGGPWVSAKIWIERDIAPETFELTGPERFVCEVDGQRRDAFKVWTFLRPISKAEYDALNHRITMIPAMQATMVRIDLTETPILPE